MKLISDILKQKKWLPEFNPGDVISAIMSNGYPVPCKLQLPNEIKCPMCGSSNGYRVVDGEAVWWACTNDNCIQRNAKRPIKPVQPQSTQLIEHMKIPMRLQDVSVEQWKHSPELLKIAMDYIKHPQEICTVTGKNGRGKSYLAALMVIELYKRYKQCSLFYNVSDLYQEWLDQSDRPINLINRLTHIDLLVLDDLGTRTPSEGFTDFIYLIINSRYANMLGIVITTNAGIDELTNLYGTAITSRILSGKVIKMEGQDLRA